ncbi:MAG: B12-binding domain-containing radical SAM protein [Lachnospiraceae bacterium]|nr:B12-binding domain-containing radical SAM protein [Lachnospiraceae bacterium]
MERKTGKRLILLCYVRLQKANDLLWDYIGLFYLAGALERAGYEALVWHGDWRGLKEQVLAHRPDAVGFSIDAENQAFLESLIPSVRDSYSKQEGREPLILAGGPQAMALGEAFLQTARADCILRGEGDETLPALLDALWGNTGGSAEGTMNREQRLDRIPGLCRIGEDGIYRENAGFGMVADLSNLPRPAYHTSLHRRVYGRTVFTGRGCPFSCAFCASHVGHGVLRLREIADVLSEIRENLEREKRIRYIVVQDDTFCITPERVREFCAGMRKIRKSRPLVWFCETHVRTLLKDPSLLREMIDSGLVRLQIGMESGDAGVLKRYNKQVTPEEILELVKMAVEMGLPQIAGNFIVGGPAEQPGVTESFIRKLLNTGAGVVDLSTGFLRSYPLTAISEDPAAFGLKIMAGNDRSGDDYPYVIPEGSTQEETMQQRQRLNRVIREEMGRLLKERGVLDDRILRQVELNERFGLSSRWMMELKTPDRAYIYEYYKMLYLGEGMSWPAHMPDPEEMRTLYPQRTFEFYRSVITIRGVHRLFGMVLSPLEYDLLFYSAGKLTVGEILDALWEKYKGAYDSREEFGAMVCRLLQLSDKRYWITVFCFHDRKNTEI